MLCTNLFRRHVSLRSVYACVFTGLVPVAVAPAQDGAVFEISVNAGYGIALGRNYNMGDIVPTNADIQVDSLGEVSAGEYAEEYAPGGNGIKFDADISFFPNGGNVGVLARGSGSVLGGYTAESQTTYAMGFEENSSITMRSMYFGGSIGLKLRQEVGPVQAFVHAGPAAFYAKYSGEGTQERGNTGNILSDDVSIETKLSPAFGFAAGAGALYRINDKIGITLELTGTAAMAKMNEYEGVLTDKVTGFSAREKIKYEEDKAVIGSGEVHGRPTFSFSSAAAKVGVCLSL